jgi:GWxTD domain-containing protein
LQFDFFVSANDYELTARVIDSESKQTSERKLSLALPQYDVGSLGLSNIELCPEIEYVNSSHDRELAFYKNGRWVVPRPDREYGVQENLLGIYFEIYGLTADEERPEGTFLLQFDIIDQKGNIEIDKTYRLDKPGKLAAISLNPSIEELTTGSYDLLVTVMDEETKRQTTHKTSFFRWSNRINVDKQNLSYSPDALRHIASSSELKRLKKTPSHEMAAALQTFWQSKDPTPNTVENEVFTDFYNRMSVANTAFGSKETPGWKTDQGGIFLRYGEPDIIYKDFYRQNKQKVEIWVYKSSGRNFVFVDRFGFGDFRLLRTLSAGY